MMPTETTEDRLQALEREVAQIKAQLSAPRPGVLGRTSPDFLDQYVGIFANDPLFEEMVRFTEEERERERRAARGETAIEDTPA